jgi:perosamine synthetase
MTQYHIPLAAPDISEDDIQAVVDVLHSSQLSLGPKLPEFEGAIASFVGAKHAVAVNSGTSALHLCVRALGIKEGDEVITTPFSFIASANCILYEKATVKFVDINPDTYCIDPALVEAAITPKTKAILAVDIFGYLADWKALKEIADKHNLVLIEDSCEALGSVRSGTHAGMFADCGMFAFYPNKQMTTGEGGVIVTNREDIANQARSERNQGRALDSKWLEHRTLGFNYRLSDINCALGTSQLKRLPEFITKRQQVVAWYAEELADITDVLSVPRPQNGVDTSWFVYVVRLADRYTAKDRNALIAHLESHDIGCNTYFPPIHLQPIYRDMGHSEGDFPITEHVADRTIALPFFVNLSKEEVASVCTILKDGLNLLPKSS